MAILTNEMLRVLRIADRDGGAVAAGTGQHAGRVERVNAATVLALIRRGLLSHIYSGEGGLGGRLTEAGRAAIAAEKKTPAQLEAEIAETLSHARVQAPHSLYKEPMQLRVTETPPRLLPGYKEAIARARELHASGVGWAAASLQSIADAYHVHSVNSESLGGDLRRVWKEIADELRRSKEGY